MSEPKPITTGWLTFMWTTAALAFVGWCGYVGWAWVSFYEYSGQARGVLIGLGLVAGVLLSFFIAICVFATDEWSNYERSKR